jgi:hypothetical protein
VAKRCQRELTQQEVGSTGLYTKPAFQAGSNGSSEWTRAEIADYAQALAATLDSPIKKYAKQAERSTQAIYLV